jgi:hypothetical protein
MIMSMTEKKITGLGNSPSVKTEAAKVENTPSAGTGSIIVTGAAGFIGS